MKSIAIGSALLAILAAGPAAAAPPNVQYFCKDGDDTGFIVDMAQGNRMTVSVVGEAGQYPGTYTYGQGSVSLAVPSVGFLERSVAVDVQLGFLVAFATPTLRCHLVAHNRGPAVAGYAKCPSIKFVAGLGYQVNAFEFTSDRGVMRRQVDEYTATSNTTITESHGVYYIQGNQVVMAFGGREDERYLSGQIHADQSFSINELEPQRGACQPQ